MWAACSLTRYYNGKIDGRISGKTKCLCKRQLFIYLPLEDFLCLLFGDLDAQIAEGLHDLLSVDATCKIQTRGKEKVRKREREK